MLYYTGISTDGKMLIGGIWSLYHQEGFPIEMSYLVCKDNMGLVDWMEVMADASITHNCPALMRLIEGFLPVDDIKNIKLGFMFMVHSGKTFEQIVQEKRNKGTSINLHLSDRIKHIEINER